MKATDIVGYAYKADFYTADEIQPVFDSLDVGVLDELDRYSSDTYPQPIFASEHWEQWEIDG